MKVLVCGGRDFDDKEFVYRTLDKVHEKYGDDLVIITGAQRKRAHDGFVGADYLAQEWAIEREVEYMGFPAKWKALGAPAAGGERNKRMRDKSKPDAAIAFTGGRGTKLMCDLLQEIGIEAWRP